MPKLEFQDSIYSLFLPLNSKYAPNMEKVRKIMMSYLFNPTTAKRQGTFIKSRFTGDTIGTDAGPEINMTERGVAGFRIMDLINKTEVRCFFKAFLEWADNYPPEGTSRLQTIYNAIQTVKPELDSHAKKEMRALGVPQPTIESVLPYVNSVDPVNVCSGVSAITLLCCLANAGNLKLDIS